MPRGWFAGMLALPLLLVPVPLGRVPCVLPAAVVPCAALPVAARRRAWRGSCGGGAGFSAGARRLRGVDPGWHGDGLLCAAGLGMFRGVQDLGPVPVQSH